MNHGNSIKKFTDDLPERIKQIGTTEEVNEWKYLRAGKLKMIYRNGTIRYLSGGNNELIRMIYAAVRDKDWQVVLPHIEDENITIDGNSFSIEFKCRYKNAGIDFLAGFTIYGSEDNSITLIMDGQALETFEKNRIGWCVLHPVEGCAGTNCIIEHSNGSTTQSAFPEEISPYQIFSNIRSMNWMNGKINCKISFEGDVFETEDQRNWTDASFKTYSTPLSLPFPVTIDKDTRIYQKIVLNFNGQFEEDRDGDKVNIVRLYPDETYRIPELGICRRSSGDGSLRENEAKILRALRFDHYRIDIHLYKKDWQKEASKAASESHDLGFPVEVALFFDDSYETLIKSFIKWYSEERITIASVLLFHFSIPLIPDERVWEIIRNLRETDPQIKVAAGTNANFAQLNRNRPGDSRNDSVCFSIHPQEHLSDNLTLVENLKAQGYAVSSAKRYFGNKKIAVSPVTIQRRFNANKSLFEIPYIGNDMPPQVDSRLMSLFGACWTAISVKYICEAGADSITYYETAGERGIIQGETDPQWPGQFRTVKGMIFPVYHVFRFILANKSFHVLKSTSSRPLDVDCLALSDGKQARLILVNFTSGVQTVLLECCSGLFRIRTLSTDSFSEAASNMRWTGMEKEKVIKSQNIFDLEPFSINFIEGWKKH